MAILSFFFSEIEFMKFFIFNFAGFVFAQSWRQAPLEETLHHPSHPSSSSSLKLSFFFGKGFDGPPTARTAGRGGGGDETPP